MRNARSCPALLSVHVFSCRLLVKVSEIKILRRIEEILADSDEGIKTLDKVLLEAEIAENNSIGTQLITHQIR